MSQQPPPQQPFGQQPPGPYAGKPPQKSGTSTGLIIGIVLGAVALGSLCFCGIGAALLLPAVQAAREAARQSASANNLKQIGLAFHNYHDSFKDFPAAVTVDDDGKPRNSWRAAILPFAEQQGLYENVDFHKPWNEPPNRALGQQVVPYMLSPSDTEAADTDTSYVVICDPESAFPPDRALSLSYIKDGTSNTICVIEFRNSGINWMEPRDVTIDEAVEIIKSSARPVNALFVDGAVRAISPEVDRNTLRAMMTRDGGEEIGN